MNWAKMKWTDKIKNIYTLFICYAICGWLFELIIWIFKENQIMNRGFLFGPWLPIYGFGGLLIYKFVYPKSKEPLIVKGKDIRPWTIFLLIAVSATVVEFVSTYILDLAGVGFLSLWDYSEYNINFQSRIALIPAIQFGILGNAIIYLAQPKIEKFINSDSLWKYVLMLLFTADLIIHIFTGSTYTDVPILLL